MSTATAPLPTGTDAGLAEAIRALGLDIALRDAADLAGRDPGGSRENFAAGLMALPKDAVALQGLLAFCARRGVAVTPQGGRTGLVAGTLSAAGMLIVSTERMNRIEEIDPVSRVAVVGAGVTLEALQRAAAEHGLEPGIDLGARGTATIGGMVATNAGGIQAFRHGTMRRRVLGLEAVLPDGTLVSDMSRVLKSSCGYDMKQLLIGAEGTLGVIARVVVQLAPRPQAEATALLALPSVSAGLTIANRLTAAQGIEPLACEMMWRDFLTLNATAQDRALTPALLSAPASLLVEIAGPDHGAARAAMEALVAELWEEGLATDAILAQTAAQRDALWRLREDMSVFTALYPGLSSFDISLPPSRIEAWTQDIAARLDAIEPGLAPLIFAHIADGNLHVIPRRGGYSDALRARVEDTVYEGLIEMGGSISAEHGIGTKKRAAFERFVPAANREAMRAIKLALDPRGLMNPGAIWRTAR